MPFLINKERNYLRLKEKNRVKYDQLGDIEQDKLIEHDKSIRQNERQENKITKNLQKFKVSKLFKAIAQN